MLCCLVGWLFGCLVVYFCIGLYLTFEGPTGHGSRFIGEANESAVAQLVCLLVVDQLVSWFVVGVCWLGWVILIFEFYYCYKINKL